MPPTYVLLGLAAVWAGAQNALAGGGSFVTLPALILTGLDARTANITSTVALFPGQVSAGLMGRRSAQGVDGIGLRELIVVSVLGGLAGALLLLATPAGAFARLAPFLVLFATGVFWWGNFLRKPGPDGQRVLGPRTSLAVQFAIGVYGGYYGGGNGFLMLALLSLTGQSVRSAGATKNLVIALINGSAVLLFLTTPGLDWIRIAIVAIGALVGGWGGVWLLRRIDEQWLKIGIVCLGVLLAIGLFLRNA
jgi:uncharacterized protein